MRAGVIPRYLVAHAHSRYPNCQRREGNFIFFASFRAFFGIILFYILPWMQKNMTHSMPGTWQNLGIVSIEGFPTLISHVLQKFKMADSGSMLSEIAHVYAIPQNMYISF